MELFFGIRYFSVAQIGIYVLESIEIVDETVELSSLFLSHYFKQVEEFSTEEDYSGGNHTRVSKV